MEKKISKIILGIIIGAVFSPAWFLIGKLQPMSPEATWNWKDALLITSAFGFFVILGWVLKSELED